MKQYTFTIYFVGAGQVVITAGCMRDAVILACAERLKKGFHMEAYSVRNHDTNEVQAIELDSIRVNWHGSTRTEKL